MFCGTLDGISDTQFVKSFIPRAVNNDPSILSLSKEKEWNGLVDGLIIFNFNGTTVGSPDWQKTFSGIINPHINIQLRYLTKTGVYNDVGLSIHTKLGERATLSAPLQNDLDKFIEIVTIESNREKPAHYHQVFYDWREEKFSLTKEHISHVKACLPDLGAIQRKINAQFCTIYTNVVTAIDTYKSKEKFLNQKMKNVDMAKHDDIVTLLDELNAQMKIIVTGLQLLYRDLFPRFSHNSEIIAKFMMGKLKGADLTLAVTVKGEIYKRPKTVNCPNKLQQAVELQQPELAPKPTGGRTST